MKSLIKLFILFVVIMTVTFCVSKPTLMESNRIIGKWVGESEGEKGSITFNIDGTALIELEDYILGSNDDYPLILKYEIDYSQSPIYLDFIAYDDEFKYELGRIKGLLNFITAGQIEICINFDEINRPNNFECENKDEDYIILDRIQ